MTPLNFACREGHQAVVALLTGDGVERSQEVTVLQKYVQMEFM